MVQSTGYVDILNIRRDSRVW